MSWFCSHGNLQLESSDVTPSMKIAALRTLSYTLKTLGEVRHYSTVQLKSFLLFFNALLSNSTKMITMVNIIWIMMVPWADWDGETFKQYYFSMMTYKSSTFSWKTYLLHPWRLLLFFFLPSFIFSLVKIPYFPPPYICLSFFSPAIVISVFCPSSACLPLYLSWLVGSIKAVSIVTCKFFLFTKQLLCYDDLCLELPLLYTSFSQSDQKRALW